MTHVEYTTPDGTESYHCDETHTDTDPLLTALRYDSDGKIVERQQFPLTNVVRVVNRFEH